MGSFISRFRRKPTTEEQLKKIEDGLRKIEDYKRSTERKHKKLVANIIIYSAALYILACVIVFVWWLPESWMIRLALLVALVLVPVIVYLLKRLVSKYFDSRMIKANEEYSDLQRKKKDIIDSVMETETFNKAKEILSKYAPEKLDKKVQPPVPERLQQSNVRKRIPVQQSFSAGAEASKNQSNSLVMLPRRDLSPVTAVNPSMSAKHRLPQPVFPKERGISDKLIEFMIGDGPGYRYALICNHCKGHNGMALKEEFPYLAFNCCYCAHYNPARSKRPSPPRLADFPMPSVAVKSSSTPALPAPSKKAFLLETEEVVRGDKEEHEHEMKTEDEVKEGNTSHDDIDESQQEKDKEQQGGSGPHSEEEKEEELAAKDN